jgi:hypothetical protein
MKKVATVVKAVTILTWMKQHCKQHYASDIITHQTSPQVIKLDKNNSNASGYITPICCCMKS